VKVVLSSRAVADLGRIRDFIAPDNPIRAASFVEELRETARRLADLPHGFPLVPRYERHGIRRRSYRGYGILGPGQDHDRALRLN
jgi:plasmid stabilization system protein ParE